MAVLDQISWVVVGYAVLVAQLPDPSPVWLAISVAYVAYYVALSLHLTARRVRPVPTVG